MQNSKGTSKPWYKNGIVIAIIIIIGSALAFALFKDREEKNAVPVVEQPPESVPATTSNATRADEVAYVPGEKEFDEAMHYIGTKSEQAKELLEKAAADGYEDAKGVLGEMYAFGLDVEQDTVKGIEMLEEAVKNGSSYAMAKLGEMYIHGCAGLEKNVEKGLDLIKQAMEKGKYYGFLAMAKLYEIGAGVEKDFDKAISYLEEAGKHGYLMAKEEMEDLGMRPNFTMSPETLAHVYYVDAADADAKYNGHKIRMAGVVEAINAIDGGNTTLTLRVKDVHYGINCVLESDADTLANKLKLGDRVVIQGICKGKSYDVVILEDCWFPVSQNPTLVQE